VYYLSDQLACLDNVSIVCQWIYINLLRSHTIYYLLNSRLSLASRHIIAMTIDQLHKLNSCSWLLSVLVNSIIMPCMYSKGDATTKLYCHFITHRNLFKIRNIKKYCIYISHWLANWPFKISIHIRIILLLSPLHKLHLFWFGFLICLNFAWQWDKVHFNNNKSLVFFRRSVSHLRIFTKDDFSYLTNQTTIYAVVAINIFVV